MPRSALRGEEGQRLGSDAHDEHDEERRHGDSERAPEPAAPSGVRISDEFEADEEGNHEDRTAGAKGDAPSRDS